MNRTSAEATKMLITLERNLTVGLHPMVSTGAPTTGSPGTKQFVNKCCIFSVVHSPGATGLGGFITGTELIRNGFSEWTERVTPSRRSELAGGFRIGGEVLTNCACKNRIPHS